METTVKSPRNRWTARKMAVLSTFLFLAALSGLLILQDKNWKLDSVLTDNRIQQEKLMGEKQQLEKSVARFKTDLAKLSGEKGELNATITQQLAQLDQLEKENKRFRSTAAQVDGLKKQKGLLEAMVKEMEQDMRNMGNTISDLTAENSKIRTENRDLTANNSRLLESVSALQEVAINNALVEAVQGKKKQRLTVVAKRTKNLKMEVDLPTNMAENLTLKVIGPDGKVLTDKDGTASVTEVLNDGTFTASLTVMADELVAAKRMRLEFVPNGKMKQGTYTLEVSNAKKSLGKVQIKLR